MQFFFRLGRLESQNRTQLRPVTYMQSLSQPAICNEPGFIDIGR